MRLAIVASVVLCSIPSLAADPAGDLRSPGLQSPQAAVRAQAVAAIGLKADKAGVPALVAALNDSDKTVRREAAKALAAIPDACVTAALTAALRDRDANVRFYAAYALGEIKDPKSADVLLPALEDPEWCVRDQAAWALREIGDRSIVPRLAASLGRREADVPHIQWLLRHLGGPQAVTPLANLLTSGDAEIRLRAVKTLIQLRQPDAAEPLTAAMADADPRVRLVAINGLLNSAPDRIETRLADLLAQEKDPDVLAVLQEAARRGTREDDLMGNWNFDDGNTSLAKDLTGNGNDGRIRGCTPVAGKVGTALQFGKGKYVALGKPPKLPVADAPFTIMAWIKTDAPDGVVVGRGGAFSGFSLYVKDNVAKFGIHREKDGPTHIAAGTDKVVGRWVHLAGVVDRAQIAVYVDGKLAGTAKTTGPLANNCGQGMEIGFDEGNSAVEITTAFEGIIDEVKMFRAALSEKDVAKQMKP